MAGSGRACGTDDSDEVKEVDAMVRSGGGGGGGCLCGVWRGRGRGRRREAGDDDDEMCLRGRELIGRPVQAATVDRPAGGGTAGGGTAGGGRGTVLGEMRVRNNFTLGLGTTQSRILVGARQPGRRVSTSSSPTWSSDKYEILHPRQKQKKTHLTQI